MYAFLLIDGFEYTSTEERWCVIFCLIHSAMVNRNKQSMISQRCIRSNLTIIRTRQMWCPSIRRQKKKRSSMQNNVESLFSTYWHFSPQKKHWNFTKEKHYCSVKLSDQIMINYWRIVSGEIHSFPLSAEYNQTKYIMINRTSVRANAILLTVSFFNSIRNSSFGSLR